MEDGIFLLGDKNTLIQDNYIHDLKANLAGSPHYDGIQIEGSVSNVVIRHNTVINDYGQTSAVMIDNYFGPISNITVDNNLLVGGGYTIYVDGQFTGGSVTGVSITNNHMGRAIVELPTSTRLPRSTQAMSTTAGASSTISKMAVVAVMVVVAPLGRTRSWALPGPTRWQASRAMTSIS